MEENKSEKSNPSPPTNPPTKRKINPLYIKDANFVMISMLINLCILYYILHKCTESNVFTILTVITCITTAFCFAFSFLILIGWFIACITGNVVYVENKQKTEEKGKNNATNNK